MGVPPTVMWGADRPQVTDRHGVTRHVPMWSRRDYLLLALLEEWEHTDLCVCGRPRSEHEGKTAADYAALRMDCPALEAMEREQTKLEKRRSNPKATPDPRAWESWTTVPNEVAEQMFEAEQAANQPTE